MVTSGLVSEQNQEWFIMDFIRTPSTIIFDKMSPDGVEVVQRIYLNPLFLQMNFMDAATVEQWKRRPGHGEVTGAAQDCAMCLEEVDAEDLYVLSACRHLCCISCSDKWYQEKGDLECCLCRTTSMDFMRAGGYRNLTKIRIFDALE